MTRISSRLRRWAASLAVITVIGALAACNGPTTSEYPANVGDVAVSVSMDPHTLNPPQIATINYLVTEAATSKPVKSFGRVAGALFHNILISRDMQHFQHSFTNRVLNSEASLQTYFPETGRYYSVGLFAPAGAQTQVYRGTVQSGDEGPEPNLQVQTGPRANRQYGLRLDLLTGPEPLRANAPAQIAVYVSERGQGVNAIWPFLDAPGYLWVIDQEGEHFGWAAATAPSHRLLPTAVPSDAQGTATVQATRSPQATQAPPTLIPELADLLAERTAQPAPTLLPVQATAQASILEPSLVQPEVGYGPYLLFAHTFPEAGIYKMWVEFKYRNQVIYGDWVVQVEE